jgi:hypothetical protein
MEKTDEYLAVRELDSFAVAKKRLFRIVAVTDEFRKLHSQIVSTLLRNISNRNARLNGVNAKNLNTSDFERLPS